MLKIYQVLELSSGNCYYYRHRDGVELSYGFMADPENNILDGFMDEEADRRYEKILPLAVDRHVRERDMYSFSFDRYMTQLGEFEETFRNIVKYQIQSTGEHARLERYGGACESRFYYYKVVGADNISGRRKFPLWTLVGNHLAILGRSKFNTTFKNGSDSTNHNSRYSTTGFAAPSAYIRRAVDKLIIEADQDREIDQELDSVKVF